MTMTSPQLDLDLILRVLLALSSAALAGLYWVRVDRLHHHHHRLGVLLTHIAMGLLSLTALAMASTLHDTSIYGLAAITAAAIPPAIYWLATRPQWPGGHPPDSATRPGELDEMQANR